MRWLFYRGRKTPFYGDIDGVFFDSVELKKCMEKRQMLWYDEYAVETFQQKGGETMDYILRLLVSVMASVAGYYIRKWLDRNDKDS